MIRRQVTIGEDGWPVHEASFSVSAGQTVTVTTRADVAASSTMLPITYDKFTEMAQKGDTIYVGRYLVSGADSASLYLDVVDVQGEHAGCVHACTHMRGLVNDVCGGWGAVSMWMGQYPTPDNHITSSITPHA